MKRGPPVINTERDARASELRASGAKWSVVAAIDGRSYHAVFQAVKRWRAKNDFPVTLNESAGPIYCYGHSKEEGTL